MDRRQFRCWGTCRNCWDIVEIKGEWTARRADRTVERDHDGKNSAVQLETDKAVRKHTIKEEFAEGASAEESDIFEAPTQEDMRWSSAILDL